MRFLALLLLLPGLVLGQTIVTTTKPFGSKWSPADFAGYEVRLNGRKGTDPASTNKIISRIVLKSLDFSLLTQRITVLVPANETWEIKSVSVQFVPQIATGIDPFDIPLRKFAASHFPPSGQVLAIDIDSKSGNVMMGPVTVIVLPAPTPVPTPTPSPAVNSLPGDCSPPLGQLSLGGTWTVSGGNVSKDGVVLGSNAYPDLSTICVSANGTAIRAISPTKGYECWTGGPSWTGSGC